MQPERIADGVYRLRLLTVSVYFVAERWDSWALVDSGLRGYAGGIRRAAERLFNRPPMAILLMHWSFRSRRRITKLANDWRALR